MKRIFLDTNIILDLLIRDEYKPIIRALIDLILDLFNIVSNDRSQLEKAIKFEAPDFEDVLQYQAALSAKCEVILTRNAKDFPFAKIPAMSVPEFLKIG